MLNPDDDRLDYGRILAPPAGYKLDFAIGTTYSLDLNALVGICIALGLAAETDSELMKNPVCLLEALRAVGDKLALFCEGGQIHVPNHVTSLYILLEKIVFQVSPPKKRGIAKYPSFHPKFWLIRYIDENKNTLYRVAVLSRNLTFDRSWDVTFCMEGTANGIKTLKTSPLCDFLDYLAENPDTRHNSKEKRKKIKSIINELPYVHFKLDSDEFHDFEFLPLGVKSKNGIHSTNDKSFDPLFKDNFNEILIMTPFLSKSIIRDFNCRNKSYADHMLFTRAAELEKLSESDCDNFRIFTMKDAVIDGESAISEDEQQIQKQDIHAKMYMVRSSDDSYLYLGSMNASHNAVYGNIEFMIRLKSKKSHLNLKKLSEDLFNGDENSPSNPFWETDLSYANQTDDKSETLNLLSDYIKELIRMKPTAEVIANDDFFDLRVIFPEYEPPEFTVKVSPLLSDKQESMAKTITFRNLLITQLSEFYKITVTDGTSEIEKIIIIPTKNIPEEREKAVVTDIIKDEKCFYRYVAFLLGDSYAMGAFESGAFNDSSTSYKNFRQSANMPALYEKMLRTAVESPEKFKEIEYLINMVSSDGIIPDGFEKLYDTFRKAMK